MAVMPCPMLVGRASETLIPLTWGGVAYVSEKYDGWRMIYCNGKFYTRNGNLIKLAPALYEQMSQLPQDITYDGELWMGYGTFSTLAGIDTSTTNVHFKIFDIIALGTFEQRWQQMQLLFKYRKFPNVALVKHTRCTTTSDIEPIYDKIIARGGEGIVLRSPDGLYECDTRSRDVLKKKPLETAELLVIGYSATVDSAAIGIVSSLVCRTIDSRIVKVTVKTKTPAPIGSIIAVEHSQFTVGGLPKFPVYLGIRPDCDVDAEILEVFRAELDAPDTKSISAIPTKPRKQSYIASTKQNLAPTSGEERCEKLRQHGCQGVFVASELRRGASLQNGTFVWFDNERGKWYKVAKAKTTEHVYCSCEAWKYQKLPPVARTCKHCELVKGYPDITVIHDSRDRYD